MKIYRGGPAILALVLAVILIGAFHPAGALAQCGGSGGGGNSHMGYGNMGTMGDGQGGTYYPAPPVTQPPNYVTPPRNPGPAYTGPGTGSGGQMMGPGGAASGHSGHMGQTN